MKSHPSAMVAYKNVKKNRINKKKKLYKLALGVSIDLTISIYLGLFAVLGGFILYDRIQQFHEQFILLETMVSSNYIIFIFVLIMRSLVASFTRPGILFSSAELQLSMLPYSRMQLWLFCMVEKWLKTLVVLSLVAIIVGVITPFSPSFLVSVVGLIVVVQILMTIPQWRMYQVSFAYKLVVIFLVGLLGGIVRVFAGFFIPDILLLFFVLLLLIGENVLLLRDSLKQVNWMKVVQTNDLIIWNMWFVNKMSKMEINPPTRQGLLQHLFRSKKSRIPFRYQKSSAVYERLWKLYFYDQKEHVIQTLGGILLILVLLSFHGSWLLGIAISLGIFLFAQMAASFFVAGFNEKLLFSLPWDLQSWKKAFMKWVCGAGIILLLVIGVILLFNRQSWIWVPLQLLFYSSAFLHFVNLLLSEKIWILSRLSKKVPLFQTILTVLLFVLIVNSVKYPYVSFSFLFLLIIQRNYKKSLNK